MSLKGCFTIELQEKAPCTCAVGRACARLESDPETTAAARDRERYSKNDAWWSIPAGIMLIISFAVYSMNLRILALSVIIAMAVYIAAMFIRMGVKKSRLKKIDSEISPQRAVEAMLRKALRLPPRGKDISRLVTGDNSDVFSASLLGAITAKARECGVEPAQWAVNVRTDLSGMVSAARDAFSAPVRAVVIVKGEGGQCRFNLEYMASFACASTGDCLPVDLSPVIADITPADMGK